MTRLQSTPGAPAAVRPSPTVFAGRLVEESAIYIVYMASRAQYVRLPGPLSGSSGSGGSGNPVSSLFSTGGRSPNPTLSANSHLRRDGLLPLTHKNAGLALNLASV